MSIATQIAALYSESTRNPETIADLKAILNALNGGAALGVYCPIFYGAIGDGVANDSAAFSTMLAAINAAGGCGTILLSNPATGAPLTYRLQTAVVAALGAQVAKIRILGGGSALRMGLGAGTCLLLSATGYGASLEVADVRFIKDGAVVPTIGLSVSGFAARFSRCSVEQVPGTAIKVASAKQAMFEECAIDGGALAAGSALALVGVDRSSFIQCDSKGGAAAYVAYDVDGTSIDTDFYSCSHDGGVTANLTKVLCFLARFVHGSVFVTGTFGGGAMSRIMRQAAGVGFFDVLAILQFSTGTITAKRLQIADAGAGTRDATVGSIGSDIVGVACENISNSLAMVIPLAGFGVIVDIDAVGAIAVGDHLAPSSTVAGKVKKVTVATTSYMGICISAGNANATCEIIAQPGSIGI